MVQLRLAPILDPEPIFMGYCPADNTIYYYPDFAGALVKLSAEYAHTNGAYGLEAAVAHEWGHAVQAIPAPLPRESGTVIFEGDFKPGQG